MRKLLFHLQWPQKSVVLGRSPESWLLMQGNYDFWKARKKIDLNNYKTIEFAV